MPAIDSILVAEVELRMCVSAVSRFMLAPREDPVKRCRAA